MTGSIENALNLASTNHERSIRVLRELVRIPSLTGEEGEAQKYLGTLLGNSGAALTMEEPDIEAVFERFPHVAQYPTHWQHDLILPYAEFPTYEGLQSSGLEPVLNYAGRPNVVGVFKGKGGGRSLILNGHIDTVTIEPTDEWTREPFGAEVEDGRMYGRGTSDMKGGLLAGIMAMIYLSEAGADIGGDVTVESVVNEEHAGNGTLDLVRRGFTADGAIVLEPTNNKVAVSHPGGLYWQVTVPGRPRSPGARWKDGALDGVSAIEKLPGVISALLELESKFNAEATDDPMEQGRAAFSLVIGRVSAGHYETVTASEAVLRGGAYFSPVMGDIGEVMAAMTQAIDEANAADDFLCGNPARLEFLHHDDSTRQSPQIPLAVALSNALKERGESGDVIPGPFACDCRHLVNQGGIPSVIFGPGTIAQAHKPDEHIEIEEYLACIEHLIAFIGSWCNETRDRSFEDAAKEALPV
ncbi:MAG: M20/M25/M40 family metallo-hydrolase [Rhodospirillaceae bacterium]|nr:M20/M25/M40 family metallo-hydrolase [Rhodospirillaceae bacterium]